MCQEINDMVNLVWLESFSRLVVNPAVKLTPLATTKFEAMNIQVSYQIISSRQQKGKKGREVTRYIYGHRLFKQE